MGIRAIYINLPMKDESYAVGNPLYYNDERIVTEIRDNSVDAERNYIPIVEIIVDGQVVKELINTPMTIEHN